MKFYSTNNKQEQVNLETALLNGLASNYGLYMMARAEVPKLTGEQIKAMSQMSYAQIAFEILNPYIDGEIPENKFKALLDDAYREDKIPTKVEHVTGKTHILWLTQGPTYSFKDYAARFFARSLSYFLKKRNQKRVVMVATSGDTGSAVADALYGLNGVDNIVFFPKGRVSEQQRRQMTTLKDNIYAFEVNADFDVCQALAKNLLGDKEFAKEVFNDGDRITSANSISIGRLLPQMVYPFYAYSRVAKDGEPMIASIPSGNFGDIMGTIMAKEMGLPISKMICGVNENKEFPEFLKNEKYKIEPTKKSPSVAMNVSHPSNLARLIDFYKGHIYDQRDPQTKKVIKTGVIDQMPNLQEIKDDIFSISISDQEHYQTIKKVYEKHSVILDPHGSVSWAALDNFLNGKHEKLAMVYETADPGKFPDDIQKAIGVLPEIPPRIKEQARLQERIYTIESQAEETPEGLKLSDNQIQEAKIKIREIFLLGKF